MTPDTPHEADDDAVEAADGEGRPAPAPQRLREQIARMKGKAGGPPSDEPPASTDHPRVPRDFIDRKMREADGTRALSARPRGPMQSSLAHRTWQGFQDCHERRGQ